MVYDNCPVFENENFKLRLIEENDATDLLSVYSDKFALPFFNSDNCNGSNFYCATGEDMENTIKYWLIEYQGRGFVRFSIVDKNAGKAIGTIELFNRKADDYFNNCGLLRLDVRSDYEKSDILSEILFLITAPTYELFDCSMIATKAPIYAVERIDALRKLGYEKSEEKVVGHDGTVYGDYWCVFK